MHHWYPKTIDNSWQEQLFDDCYIINEIARTRPATNDMMRICCLGVIESNASSQATDPHLEAWFQAENVAVSGPGATFELYTRGGLGPGWHAKMIASTRPEFLAINAVLVNCHEGTVLCFISRKNYRCPLPLLISFLQSVASEAAAKSLDLSFWSPKSSVQRPRRMSYSSFSSFWGMIWYDGITCSW